MPFTPAELAEMARADAEIEASFRFTNEEIALGRVLDREAALAALDSAGRTRAEAQRRYREANKEKVSEGKRRYREANKEKVSEGKRALRALRVSLGMSQSAFAAALGVSQPTVCYWETVREPANWQEIIQKFKEDT